MTKKFRQAISFGGYAATGGSVIRDLLKEFDGVAVFPTEFRIIKEHYGLLDLKSSLFFSPSPEKTDLAIKDFIWLCNHLARGSHKVMRSGHSYDEHTNEAFSGALKNFISSLVDYTYPMSWHFYDFKKGYLEYTLSRILRRLNKNFTCEKPAYMSTISEEKFDTQVNRFLQEIFDGFMEKQTKQASVIGLHNAIAPTSVESLAVGSKLLEGVKVIVVDRDPRDVYLDFPQRRYLPEGIKEIDRARSFVNFYLKLREQQKTVYSRNNVLPVSFEKLVCDYDLSLDVITRFVGSEIGTHEKKLKYFNPELSKINIGKYKNASGEKAKAIKYIESKLSEFIY